MTIHSFLNVFRILVFYFNTFDILLCVNVWETLYNYEVVFLYFFATAPPVTFARLCRYSWRKVWVVVIVMRL